MEYIWCKRTSLNVSSILPLLGIYSQCACMMFIYLAMQKYLPQNIDWPKLLLFLLLVIFWLLLQLLYLVNTRELDLNPLFNVFLWFTLLIKRDLSSCQVMRSVIFSQWYACNPEMREAMTQWLHKVCQVLELQDNTNTKFI
jgi:hypothetical protein